MLTIATDCRYVTDEHGVTYALGSLHGSLLAHYFDIDSDVRLLARLRQGTPPSGAVTLSEAHQPASVSIPRAIAECLGPPRRAVLRLPGHTPIIYGLGLALRRHHRYVCELVGDAKVSYSSSGKPLGRILGWIADVLVRFILHRATGTIYVTRDYLQSRYPTAGPALASTDAQVSTIAAATVSEHVARRAPGPQDRIVVGFVGSSRARYKRPDVAIAACRRLSEYRKKVTLDVIGMSRIDLLSQDIDLDSDGFELRIRGRLSTGDAVIKWMDSLSLLLIASDTEGMPRVMIEAMSRGVPVVATRVGGIPELLDVDLLADKGDAEGLAHAALQLIKFPENYCRISLRCWELARDLLEESGLQERIYFMRTMLAEGDGESSRAQA
jgi:glycosyltransferase involved in cell wall biosynthesis